MRWTEPLPFRRGSACEPAKASRREPPNSGARTLRSLSVHILRVGCHADTLACCDSYVTDPALTLHSRAIRGVSCGTQSAGGGIVRQGAFTWTWGRPHLWLP